MYFEMFPKIIYTVDDYKTGQVVPDLMRRVKILDEFKTNGAFYDLYDIRDGEQPEHVASYFYSDPTLHWVILHTNEIIDPRYDWPLSQPNLVAYCKSKYGDANVYVTHHWVNSSSGLVVNSTAPSAVSISNFQYEDEINESKRTIKILKPELVSDLVSSFETLVSE